MAETNASQFQVKGQDHGGIKYAGNNFLGLLTRCRKSIGRIFAKLTPVMCYGTDMNALNLGVKRS